MPDKKYAYKIFNLLKTHYPNAKMILKWNNNFELLAAIILSAQCRDSMVNKVTTRLFPKYRSSQPQQKKSYERDGQKIQTSRGERIELINFAQTPLAELEKGIVSTGYYHIKAKRLQEAARMLIEQYGGIIPNTITELITIPGVGRKTANVFLSNAYGISEGIAVDTHVRRQSRLLKLTNHTNPEKIEVDLMSLYDKSDWYLLTYLLIEHGRNKKKKISDRKICKTPQTCLLCAFK